MESTLDPTYMIQFEDVDGWRWYSTLEYATAENARYDAPTQMYGEPVMTRIIRVERVVIDD